MMQLKVIIIFTLLFFYTSVSHAAGYLSYTVIGKYPGMINIDKAIQEVIDSEEKWKQFLEISIQSKSLIPSLPKVNFKENVLIVIGTGAKSSGGYQVMVTGIFEEEKKVTVQVLEVSPGSGCGVTMAITYPVVLVTLPKINKPFQFYTSQAKANCF